MKRILLVFSILGAGWAMACSQKEAQNSEQGQDIGRKASRAMPVILDTDIGTDIDDTWALALLLALPELDVKLIVTDSGNTVERARIVGKYLEVSGRSDIPIGIGRKLSDGSIQQSEWVSDYSLDRYPGQVHEEGVQAMIDVIMQSSEQVCIIALGPVPNIREALEREPGIVGKARVVAMSGSVDMGYDGNSQPSAEYNVAQDPGATKAMYEAGWDVLIAPLDTAGLTRLTGDRYQVVLNSGKPSIQALLENYRIWAGKADWTRVDPGIESSVLFDPVALALLIREDFCRIDTVELLVDQQGYTRRQEGAAKVRAALKWNDQEGYEDWLAQRLAGQP